MNRSSHRSAPTPSEAAPGCVVVGAGPGGLGVAAMLARAGVRALVLERGSEAAASWRGRYDRLRINTSSLTSFLPGRRFPLGVGRWPSRDELIAYYQQYARDHELDIRTNREVERIDREDGLWAVRTAQETFTAPAVVIATGKDKAPAIPRWPGREEFSGELVHAASYRNALPFEGRRVLVVGCGSSALDICVDLLEGSAEGVHMAVRRPPHLVRRSTGGIPSDLLAVALHRLPRPIFDTAARVVRRISFGDLEPYGLPLPADSFTSRVLDDGMIPTIDPGPFVAAVKADRIRVVPALERLWTEGAVLADGSALEVDVVIAATGYAPALEPLVGHLGVLDRHGRPLVDPGHCAGSAPGLHFIGFTDVLTGNLRQMRLDAKAIASEVASSISSRRREGAEGLASPKLTGD